MMTYFKIGAIWRADILKHSSRAIAGLPPSTFHCARFKWHGRQHERLNCHLFSCLHADKSREYSSLTKQSIVGEVDIQYGDTLSQRQCFHMATLGVNWCTNQYLHPISRRLLFKDQTTRQFCPSLFCLASEVVELSGSCKCVSKLHHIALWPYKKLPQNHSSISSAWLPVIQRNSNHYPVGIGFNGYRCLNSRSVATSSVMFEPKGGKLTKTKIDEDKSKVEEAVEAIKEKKEKLKEQAFQSYCAPEDLEPKAVAPAPKKPIMVRIKDEIIHYYNGFKLLYYECKIAVRLLWQVMNGKSLTRRERRQFLRTASDLFRLVPFLVFVVIPFMEFLLPVAIRLFPNMLPSTFEDKSKKEEAKKKQLKVKIQMAKFLQDTVEEMAVSANKKKTQEAVVEFANFFEKIRAKGEQPSNEDILRFSKLFEDEITLDNMNRAQLKAINRLLTLPTYGTNNYLRFQLKMRLRQLRTDDLMIKKEGVKSLTVQEVQSACQARGMRAIGVPEARLRSQLKQWIELHLEEQIPASLLLMSRAMYLPEAISKVDQLKEVLSALPEQIVEETEIKVAETAGELVDNRTRLDVLKYEELRIAEENEERIMQKIEEVAAADEVLVDKADVLTPAIKSEKEDISKEDLLTIKETLCSDREREELEKIKEDREEYQEDLRELAVEDKEQILAESVGSARLGKKVDKMIRQIEQRLETDLQTPPELKIDADGDGKISIEEMIAAVLRMERAPSEAKCRRIAEMLDQDKDGAVDLNDIDKVVELLASEDVDLSPGQITEIVELVKVEKDLLETETEMDQKEAEITRKLEQLDLDSDEKLNCIKLGQNKKSSSQKANRTFDWLFQVVELLASEDVDLSPGQITEIVELVKVEKDLLETETEMDQKEAEITRKLEQLDLDSDEKLKSEQKM